MITVKQALYAAIEQLSQAGSDSPRLDAEVLLGHLLGQERAWLYAHPETPLSPETTARYRHLLHRRANHEPVAYLTGEREFFGLTFAVAPPVLIPRPETELLVELALSRLTGPARVWDIGAGSGCIAVAVAVHAPQARLIAADISAPALALARQNARRHGVANRLALVQANLLAGLSGPVDLIISNPPYIALAEMDSLAPTVKHYEPALALTDGATGLTLIERLLAQAATRLSPGGAILIEIGAGQGNAALLLARRYFPHGYFEIKPDLAGKDRVLLGNL